MNRPLSTSHKPQIRSDILRGGISSLQLVTCLAATAAGIFVGASFLEIDMKAAWQMGLERVGLASPQAKPAPSDHPDAANGQSTEAAVSQDGSTKALTSAGKATMDFWAEIREVIKQEQSKRAQGELQAGGDQRAVLYVRTEAFREAADAIDNLESDGVDRDATRLAEDLAAWYRRGSELSEEGTRLDEADLAESGGPLGRRWHTSQRQHREQLDLLTRKTSSLRAQLSVRYQIPFPELR